MFGRCQDLHSLWKVWNFYFWERIQETSRTCSKSRIGRVLKHPSLFALAIRVFRGPWRKNKNLQNFQNFSKSSTFFNFWTIFRNDFKNLKQKTKLRSTLDMVRSTLPWRKNKNLQNFKNFSKPSTFFNFWIIFWIDFKNLKQKSKTLKHDWHSETGLGFRKKSEHHGIFVWKLF